MSKEKREDLDMATTRKKKKGLEIEGYPVEGLSIGGQETCIIFPSLKIAFDIGRCPQRAISQEFLFISHGHMDHIGGLPMYVATRGLYKLKPPTIIVPISIKENVEKLFKVHRAMDQSELNHRLVGLNVGEEFQLRKDLKVKAFRTYHSIPSQGYIVYSVKQKLKQEYVSLPGNEIRSLKLSGVEITNTVTSPEIAFTGDTMSDFIADPNNTDVLRARILVMESTFVDDAMTVENAKDYGHTHLFEIVQHADKFENKAILLIHFSARYHVEYSTRICHLLLLHLEQKRNDLKREMLCIKPSFFSVTRHRNLNLSSIFPFSAPRFLHRSSVRINSIRAMASHIVGYPRMGPKRELKFALESFWDGKSNADDLQKVAKELRVSIWKQMASAGTKFIPSNTFSYYDQVLDTTVMLGAVPPRYGWTGGEIGFDTYFSMARGNATLPAMEMTKWFDTNYHYIVPELSPDLKFTYASHKAVNEYKEAKELGIETVPVLVGPVSYLLLSKPAKGVGKSFSPLSLLGDIIPVYRVVLAELKAAGANWVQFDEPTLVLDLNSHQLQAFTEAYGRLEDDSFAGISVIIETYFADLPADAHKMVTSLKGISAIGLDLVRGDKTLELIKTLGFPSNKYLFAGVVDGRNIWANDLEASLKTLKTLEGIVGKDKLAVSTSCSLMHTAVDLVNETKLDEEIKSWLAFAAQKILEVNALANALTGAKDEEFFFANAAAQASRRSSPRVNDEAVQKSASALRDSDHRRATPVTARLDAQQKKLNLPILPTTTNGSFPQTMDLRRVRREFKAKKITEEEYVEAIKEEIYKVVKIQEELDIDVLVHGEPERNDMVEYFGEQLKGFAFTVNGWVQSYGSRCVKPPIIYGDVSRPNPMTVFWSSAAQSMTCRPMKGMLTGPVTILNWSFVRNDQPRFETCYQIALAIKTEVEDLETAGIQVIQIDEAALREGLPLRKSEQSFYLDWAVHSFRITNCGVKDTTQIHTHMCYSNFNDIIHSIIDMDADVITIENSRSDEKLLSVFREGVKYGAGIGPGVYDIHSPRIPTTEEIADRVNKMLAVLEMNVLWVNPDCGLKTRKYTEVKPALANMVAAAKVLRTELAKAK